MISSAHRRSTTTTIAVIYLLFFTLASSVPSVKPKEQAPNSSRPNILLITLDTTRADHLPCYGYREATMSYLSGIAESKGLIFTKAFTSSPLTVPAHASLMTGQSAEIHGVLDNGLFKLSGGTSTIASILKQHGYDTAAFVSSVVLDRSCGLDQGFDRYDDAVRSGRREYFNYRERGASQVVDSVLREHTRWKSPWFVWVHFYDPHDPYLPPPPYDKRFTNPYDGELAFVDAEMQRLMTSLKSDNSWRDDHDWAIVVGDHGEDLGDYGEIHHGILLTPATLRIPLIVFGPGIKAGRIETPVSITEVAQTIRSLAGILPESGVPESSGSSLLNQKHSEIQIFAETWMPYFSFRWSPQVGILDYPFLTVTGGRPEKEGNLSTRCTTLNSSWKMSEIAVSLLPEAIRKEQSKLDTFKNELAKKSWRLQADYNQLEQLRSLGYLASLPAEKGPDPFSLPDPRWKVKVYAEFLSARELIRQDKWEEARIEFAKLLDRDPDNTLLLNNLATIQEHSEEFSKAESTLRKVISLIPTMDYPYVQLGSFLGRRNRLVEARESYEKGLAINDRNAEAYLGLFQARMLGKEFKEAETIVNGAVSHGVQDPELSLFQAIFFRTAGRWTQALAAIAAADALNPTNPRILLEKEKILCQKDSSLQEQCSPYLYTSFERMNSSAEWWILAAEWHASRGELSESLYCWQNSQAASDTAAALQSKAAAAIAGLQSSQVGPRLPVWVPGISSVPQPAQKEQAGR